MIVPVMGPAQRYRELVADLASHRARLGEPQMVGVSGASPADQTGLRCNELEVSLVTVPARLADRERTCSCTTQGRRGRALMLVYRKSQPHNAKVSEIV